MGMRVCQQIRRHARKPKDQFCINVGLAFIVQAGRLRLIHFRAFAPVVPAAPNGSIRGVNLLGGFAWRKRSLTRVVK
jgi:hypothetical protein